MNRLRTVDESSWKVGWVARPENEDLIRELLAKCNEKGWLDMFFLELEGSPIAYLFLIKYRGKAYAMLTGYKQEHAYDSPGPVCFGLVLMQLFLEHQVSEVDFLSSYGYLRRWTDHMRARYIATLHPPYASSRLVRLARGILHGPQTLRHWHDAK